jgi:hypothetical protein
MEGYRHWGEKREREDEGSTEMLVRRYVLEMMNDKKDVPVEKA